MTIQINAATLALLVLTILWMPNICRFAITPFVIIAGAINAVIFSFFYTLYRLIFKRKQFIEEAGSEEPPNQTYGILAIANEVVAYLLCFLLTFLLFRTFLPEVELEIRRKSGKKTVHCINPATGKEETFPAGTLLEITYSDGRRSCVPIEAAQPILQDAYRNNWPVLLSIMRPTDE